MPEKPANRARSTVPARLGYVPALDGLRGVAILSVTCFHFFGLHGGFYGVDLFFVLSGFLITTLLLEEHDRGGSISLSSFYLRRARRLVPALAALLVAFVAIGVIAIGAGRALELAAYGGLYFANFIRAFAHPDPLAGPLGPLWSLAQEEQFYLVWPLVLIVLLRRRIAPGYVMRILALAFVALVAYRAGLAAMGETWHRIYYAPDAHADGLVAGCLVAYMRRRGVRVGGILSIAALGAFFAAVFFGAETIAWSVYGLPIVEATAAVLILSVAGSGVLANVLSLRPLVWVGTLSYSLYIWGQFGRWLAAGTDALWLALALTAGFTLLSYYLIERPFRRRPRSRLKAVVAPSPVGAL
jgi:peptidoglycan/LPS O-acetylase OafA/YrhL